MRVSALSLVSALLATIAVSFLAAGQAPVATPPDPTAAPPAPQFQVEILVFANREFDSSEERFPQELPTDGLAAAAALLEVPVFDESTVDAVQPEVPADGVAVDTREPGFRPLRPEELLLGAEYQKLARLSAYVPLVHGGWVQPGLPEEQSQPVDLALLGALNPRGSVRVYLSRFLHVNLDLTYQGSADTATSAPAAAGDLGDLGEITIAPRFKLVSERNVRSGELHYFDHPAFGVLVKITPLPADTTTATGRRPAA